MLSAFDRKLPCSVRLEARALDTAPTVTKVLLTALERLAPCANKLDAKIFESERAFELIVPARALDAPANAFEKLDP